MESRYRDQEIRPKKRKVLKSLATETKTSNVQNGIVKKMICFTQDNSEMCIAIVLANFQIRIYNVSNLSKCFTIVLPNSSATQKIKKIDSQGINLVFSDNTNLFYIVDLKSEEFLIVEGFKTTALIVMKNYFVTGDKAGLVQLWDMKGKNVFYVNTDSQVDILKAVANDKFVVSAHWNNTIKILDLNQKVTHNVNFNAEELTIFDIDSDEQYVYVLQLDNTVNIFKIEESTISHYKNINFNENIVCTEFLACRTNECTYFLLNSSSRVLVIPIYDNSLKVAEFQKINVKGKNIKLTQFYGKSSVFGFINNKIFKLNLIDKTFKKQSINKSSYLDMIILNINSIITCTNSGELNELSF